jgi:CheY-like chemotaxis protein
VTHSVRHSRKAFRFLVECSASRAAVVPEAMIGRTVVVSRFTVGQRGVFRAAGHRWSEGSILVVPLENPDGPPVGSLSGGLAVNTPAGSPEIRVMLVDDHPVMRVGLASVLSMSHGFSVVAQAEDGLSAIDLYREHVPDIVLLDVSMERMDGIDTLRRLLGDFPAARVLMLTSSQAPEDMGMAMKAGARGYLTRCGDPHRARRGRDRSPRFGHGSCGWTAFSSRGGGARARPPRLLQRRDRVAPRDLRADGPGPRVGDPGRAWRG